MLDHHSKRPMARWFALAAIALLVGCEDEYQPNSPDRGDEQTVVADSVVALTEATEAQIQSLSEDLSSLTISRTAPQAAQLIPGAVAVSSQGYGFARRIISSTTIDNSTVLTTEQAQITQVFEKAKFGTGRTELSDVARVEQGAPAGSVQLVPGSPSVDSPGLLFNIDDVVVHDHDGDPQSEADQIRIRGSLNLAPVIDFRAEIVDGVIESADFIQSIEVGGALGMEAGGAPITAEALQKIASVDFQPITAVVGPVVVVFVPRMELSVGTSADVVGPMTVRASFSGALDGGVGYSRVEGWSDISGGTTQLNFELSEPLLGMEGSAKCFLRANVFLMLYRVVGPGASAELGLAARIAPQSSPMSTLGAEACYRAGIQGPLLNFVDGDYEAKLLTLSVPIHESCDAPSQPASPMPSHGAELSDTPEFVSWSGLGGADRYELYFGTNASPGTGEFQGSVTDTTWAIDASLEAGSCYFWRVDAVKDCGETTTGDVWSFCLEGPCSPPSKPGNPQPSNGGQLDYTPEFVSWSGLGGADRYELYFGTNSTLGAGEFQGSVTDTTWAVDESVEPGVCYYWRVDAVKDCGETTTGDVWSFCLEEICTPPSKPGNPVPSNGGQLDDTPGFVSWTGHIGTDRYELYFGTNASPGTGEFQGSVTDTTWTIDQSLEPGGCYYWRVDAVKDCGETTTGEVWSFCLEETCAPPSKPGNPVPSNGGQLDDTPGFVSWSGLGGADRYELYFGTNASPGTGEFRGSVTDTTWTIDASLEPGSCYYWRVDAVKDCGETTTGEVWSFCLEESCSPPPKPGNPEPSNGQELERTPRFLSWSGHGGTDRYEVYFGTNSSPGSGEYQGSVTDTKWRIDNSFKSEVCYYWRIDAVKDCGETTTGEIWSFCVDD